MLQERYRVVSWGEGEIVGWNMLHCAKLGDLRSDPPLLRRCALA